jgi:hypothetical protein
VIYEDSRSTVSVGYEAWRMGRDLLRVWRSVRGGLYRHSPASPAHVLLDEIRELCDEVELERSGSIGAG